MQASRPEAILITGQCSSLQHVREGSRPPAGSPRPTAYHSSTELLPGSSAALNRSSCSHRCVCVVRGPSATPEHGATSLVIHGGQFASHLANPTLTASTPGIGQDNSAVWPPAVTGRQAASEHDQRGLRAPDTYVRPPAESVLSGGVGALSPLVGDAGGGVATQSYDRPLATRVVISARRHTSDVRIT